VLVEREVRKPDERGDAGRDPSFER